jgi:hypothetical protein
VTPHQRAHGVEPCPISIDLRQNESRLSGAKGGFQERDDDADEGRPNPTRERQRIKSQTQPNEGSNRMPHEETNPMSNPQEDESHER